MSGLPYFLVVAFVAFFVKGVTGFGNTLVLAPLFSFRVSNRLITPVDLLLSLPANAWMAFRERKHISAKIVVPLSILLIVGIIPGVFLLKSGSDWVLKSALGAVVVLMAMEMLLRKPGEGDRPTHPVLLGVIGIASGVLCGLFGIGALLVAYISRTTNTHSAFRANLCFVFLIENLFRLVIYLATGLLGGAAAILALELLPAAAAGLLLGILVSRRMRQETARRIVILLLIASGASLLITNLFFH